MLLAAPPPPRMFFLVFALALQALAHQDGAAAEPERVPELAVELLDSPRDPRSSAFPSWRTGGAAPALVVTRLGERGAATLELRDPLGAAPARALAEGGGWLLNWADVPAVAQLGDGTTLATWLALEPAHEHSYGTRFVLLPASGEEHDAPRPLEEHDGPGEHGFVSLAPLDSARFLALWLDGRAAGEHGAGETRVYSRTVARDGALGPETVVDPSACSCCPTALVRLADGSHLAAWRDRSAEEVRDVSVARFHDGQWSEPAPVHADGWKIDGCPVNGPRLAASPERVAATWFTGADNSVRVAFADALGRGFGAPLRVDDGAPEGRGDAVFLADGSLLVAWMEHEPGESSWRARRVRPDGTPGESATIARVSSERASGFLRMTADAEGALVAYTRTGPPREVALARVRVAAKPSGARGAR